jgi:hypothetical protein
MLLWTRRSRRGNWVQKPPHIATWSFSLRIEQS